MMKRVLPGGSGILIPPHQGVTHCVCSGPLETRLFETGSRVELYRTPYLRNPTSATGLVGVELLAA